ncbi:MAG: hypothetical protein EZS28_013192 [Streblomastix strix]|uniref:Uncharacterized protein n=1 Tax=Streblomastix strix TaxID=222440 RepID=A0A5J4W8T3_9EUKA|nr:MAG: hypothetical protein EZS28_013192 [Streblomastix strix]
MSTRNQKHTPKKKPLNFEEQIGSVSAHVTTELDDVRHEIRRLKEEKQNGDAALSSIQNTVSASKNEYVLKSQAAELERQIAAWVENRIAVYSQALKESSDKSAFQHAQDLQTLNTSITSLRNDTAQQLAIMEQRMEDLASGRQAELAMFQSQCKETENAVGTRIESLQRMLNTLKDGMASMKGFMEVFITTTSAPAAVHVIGGNTLSSLNLTSGSPSASLSNQLGMSVPSVLSDQAQVAVIMSKIRTHVAENQQKFQDGRWIIKSILTDNSKEINTLKAQIQQLQSTVAALEAQVRMERQAREELQTNLSAVELRQAAMEKQIADLLSSGGI